MNKSVLRTVTLIACLLALGICIGGLLLLENLIIPVKGASPRDWNHHTFWHHPWGKSGVHKGIDIFAREGTPVLAASSGVVIFAGTSGDGGNVVAVLGPKWRVHYYAHLREIEAGIGAMVTRGARIGTVGTTGNAAGKPPHLHYAIITQIPYVWRFRPELHGFDRMFYLNPHEKLMAMRRG